MCGASFLGIQGAAAKDRNLPDRPNILIMIADDISQTDFGCYGNPVVRTPHIDSLASEGMLFSNMFLTTSSSSPSRTSIMTGRYPHNTGACELHSPVGDEQVSLARVLKDAGYYTMHAGKWHFGDSGAKPAGPFVKDFDISGGAANDGGTESGSGRWVERLQTRPEDKPFFAWFAAHDAHRTWDNDSTLRRYSPDEIILPEQFVDNDISREDFASYYYEVSRFDDSVGKVIAELKRENILDNTLIIIMADNGRPFARYKTTLTTEGVRTPFIMFCPGLLQCKGEICNSLVSVIDLAPTIMEIAGIDKKPDSFQGRSFRKLLDSPDKKFRNYVFAEHNWHDFEAHERMVCTEKYLLIENNRPDLNAEGATDIMSGGTGKALRDGYKAGSLTDFQKDIFTAPREKIQLFEYNSDPYQTHNIAPENEKAVKTLTGVLEKWKRATGDTTPEHLTGDWYDRMTLKKNNNFKKRGEMPGESANAKFNTNAGPF